MKIINKSDRSITVSIDHSKTPNEWETILLPRDHPDL